MLQLRFGFKYVLSPALGGMEKQAGSSQLTQPILAHGNSLYNSPIFLGCKAPLAAVHCIAKNTPSNSA